MGALLTAPHVSSQLPELYSHAQNAVSDPSLLLHPSWNALYFQFLVLCLIHTYTYCNGLLFDWSGVDRLWSITPVIYANSFWLCKYMSSGIVDARLLVMASLVTLWGCRLTYNFAVKGGYGFKVAYKHHFSQKSWICPSKTNSTRTTAGRMCGGTCCPRTAWRNSCSTCCS